MSQVFYSIAIWLSLGRATMTHALTGVQSRILFLEVLVRLRQIRPERAPLDRAFPGRPLIFARLFCHTNVTLILLPIRLQIRTFAVDHACRR